MVYPPTVKSIIFRIYFVKFQMLHALKTLSLNIIIKLTFFEINSLVFFKKLQKLQNLIKKILKHGTNLSWINRNISYY